MKISALEKLFGLSLLFVWIDVTMCETPGDYEKLQIYDEINTNDCVSSDGVYYNTVTASVSLSRQDRDREE